MKKTVITMEYDEKFEGDILQIRTELINYLETNLTNPKSVDHKTLVDLTHSFIFDKVKKEFSKDFKTDQLRNPQEFLLFNFKVMDFCLDYGFMILDTIAKFEQYQLEQYQNVKVFTTKIDDKKADA